jgi:hypothetical protein
VVSDIWTFQHQLTRRLMNWSTGSMLLGIMMLVPTNSFCRGLGVQFIAWGIVDAAIAWFGERAARRRQARLSSDESASSQLEEGRRLARLLWINAALDVLYVLGGVFLARRLGASNPFWLGTGVGIMIQGGFLFNFDWLHARRLS